MLNLILANKNLSNKISVNLKSRFGGAYYKKIKSIYKLKYRGGNALKDALIKEKKLLIRQFFLGYKRSDKATYEFYLNLYKTLCELYSSPDSDDQFNFNGIIIPKPKNRNEEIAFSKQATDFLIYYLVDDKAFCDAITREGPYEIENVHINEGDIVIDCGANEGIFSAVASHKGAIAYAFEPEEHIIERSLSKTASWNPNIRICQYALSDTKTSMEFITGVGQAGVGGGRLFFNEDNSRKKGNVSRSSVSAIDLDTFVKENNIPRVDFIKADIEGAERYMLMGARSVLKEFAPKISICTYHRPDDPEVLRKLILDANPNYIIWGKFQKMYAYVPQKDKSFRQ